MAGQVAWAGWTDAVALLTAISCFVCSTCSRFLSLARWLAITLGISELTYRFVEQPAINLGRRVARRVAAWRSGRPPAFGTVVPVPRAKPVETLAKVTA
jgi:peptidoglycan/LPS O-acetylase OafA/YrhL